MGTARNGLFFGPIYLALGLLLARTRRLQVRASMLAFLISFVLLVAEVTLYIRLGIMYDLSCMFLMLVPATYFLVNGLLAVRMPYRRQYTIMRYDSLLIYTSHILFVRILFFAAARCQSGRLLRDARLVAAVRLFGRARQGAVSGFEQFDLIPFIGIFFFLEVKKSTDRAVLAIFQNGPPPL